MSRNSVALLFRMLLRLLVSLYTTRVILNALGVDDFGVYNVIAGFTTMFSFVNTSMSTAISRFLAYDIGQSSPLQKLEETFRLAFSTQLILAVAAALLAESVGVPIINYYLSIPADKLFAANILYQCTIISLIINIIQVPFNATIIASERMNVYAYIEIAYAVLLLAIAFILQILKGPLLIYYGGMLVLINISIFILYYTYTRKFRICTSKVLFDWQKLKPILAFSSADLYSNASLAIQNQGQNIIINKFFGLVANASVGIASQIYGALLMFSSSITTAIRPRIIKLHAAKEHDAFVDLIINGSRLISFFNIFLCVPLFFCLRWILPIWLKEVPEYAVSLAQILLFNHCIFSYKSVLISGLHASGNIRQFSFWSGTWYILSIAIQYLLAVSGLNLGIVYSLIVIITAVNIIFILIFLRRLVNIKIKNLLSKVVIPNFAVTCSLVIIGYFLLANSYSAVHEVLIYILLFIVCTLASTLFILDKKSRKIIKNYLNKTFSRVL